MKEQRLGFPATKKNQYFFVSYSRNDAERVSAYTSQLRAHGIPLWYDSGLPGGKDWWDKIKEKLHPDKDSKKQCLGVFLFLSKELFQRKNSYVFHEFYWAINQEDTTANQKYTIGKSATEWKLDVYPIFLDDVSKKDIPCKFPEAEIPEYVVSRDDWNDIYVKWYYDILRSQCPHEKTEKQVYNRVVQIIEKFDKEDTALKDFEPVEPEQAEEIPMPGQLFFSGSYIKKEEIPAEGVFIVTGNGTVTKKRGNKTVFTYKGDVADGTLSGYGHLTRNGEKSKKEYKEYTGDFYKGKRHGYGKTTYPNGDTHTGYYVLDKRHGRGEYIFSDSQNRYNGDFAGDLFHGEGTFTWNTGNVFTGRWVDGKKKGIGTLTINEIEMKADWDGDDGEVNTKQDS